ncbi:hypothetical protein Tco_0461970 [Tanacetum coccineum]
MGIAKRHLRKVGCISPFQPTLLVVDFDPDPRGGNSTPYYDPIVATSSPTLPPFGDSDFYFSKKPTLSLWNHHFPLQVKELISQKSAELKVCETNTANSSVDEPTEVELKELPPHLEYAFLEGDNKLPVIIAKELDVEEKSALVKVLKSHKRALAWKLSDISGYLTRNLYPQDSLEED